MRPRSVSLAGPRAAQQWLLDDVVRHCEEAATGALLQRPLRIIVPSRALRQHLLARLVEGVGRPVLGVVVQTLQAAALELLERAGSTPRRGDVFFAQAVRELARTEPALVDALGGFEGGFAAAEASLADLFDAGFEQALSPASCERIEALEVPPAERERSLALLRVAVRVERLLDADGRAHRSGVLRQAAACLEAEPRLLPCSGLWVHGVADATGAATDWIEALLQVTCGTIVFGDPSGFAVSAARDVDGAAVGPAFARHFRERIESGCDLDGVVAAPPVTAPRLEALEGATPSAELALVIERVRARLSAGVAPESIQIVARRPDDWLLPLRNAFREAALPFSAVGLTVPGAEAARLAGALARIAANGERASTDDWLPAWAALRGIPPGEAAVLAVALRVRGIGRLVDFADPDAPDGPVKPRARADTADASARQAVFAAGREALAHAAAWPEQAPLREHLAQLAAVLGLRPGAAPAEDPVSALFADSIEVLSDALPSEWSIGRDDFASIVGKALAAVGDEPAGGRGGGVQLLSVTEARALCAEHTFVIGLQRDAFPRIVSEDPLLPDEHRRALTDVLPDLPIKTLGRDEERFLFAQLLESASHVAIAWHRRSERGEVRAPSPLVLQTMLTHELEPHVEESALPRQPGAGPLARARAGALDRDASAFARGLEDVQRLRARELGALHQPTNIDAVSLARAQRDAAEEADRPPVPGGPLGPGLGFVGSLRGEGSPFERPRHVTRLEDTARCGWQVFLRRFLDLEPLSDPLGALPEADRRLLGSVLHAVIEGLVDEVVPEDEDSTLEAVWVRTPVRIEWPGSRELTDRARAAAERSLRNEPVASRLRPGLAHVLARQALPLLERLRQLDARADLDGVLGAELRGALEASVGAEQRLLRFRVDRVEKIAGRIVATDFKISAPRSTPVRAGTRDANEFEDLAGGQRLQAMAYALAMAARGESQTTAARYLHLEPALDDVQAERRAKADDAAWRDAFHDAVAALGASWDTGGFAPRLFDRKTNKEPRACAYCDVRAACSRGDSGARARLYEWWSAGAPGEGATEGERALHRVWKLGQGGRGA